MTSIEPLLTETQAAKFLAISPRKLKYLLQAGDIKHVANGRNIRYAMEDIRQWIAERRKGGYPSLN